MDDLSAGATAYSMFSVPSMEGPPEPGSFEDFEYSTNYASYDYETFFPSTHSRSSSAAAFFASADPFSPSAGLSPAYLPSHFTPPATLHTPPSLDPTPLSPAPLFDPTESRLFGDFLDGFGGDQAFLFNPKLPPGMPSPPTAHLRTEDRRERDTLGHEVDNMSLGVDKRETDDDSRGMMTASTSRSESRGKDQRWQQPAPQKEEEEEEVARERVGVKTRGAVGGGRAGSGKKVKVDETTSDVEMALQSASDDDADDDPDADDTQGTLKQQQPSRRPARASGATSSSRAPARRPSTARQRANSIPNASTAALPSLAATPTPSPSPSAASSPEPSNSPSGDYTSTNGGGGVLASSDSRKAPLTDSQKRSNHILSEQKRRNAIRSGFKDLVDLLSNGELASGIVVAPPEHPAVEELQEKGRKKKAKGSGRGRGRKGDAGAGASKSVVLEKAASYIRWLERGNEGLEMEVRRVETMLGGGGRT